jgi:arylsulfatase A-like enzyme
MRAKWLILVCVLAGCRCTPAPAPTPKHVVIISIDTLRPDFLGAYGHPWVKSPNLDALAAEGYLFEDFISAAPTTLASHTSLFTGTWPHTHGVPRNGFLIHDDNVMLPELFADAGFETAAFIGGYPLIKRFNFDQGFEHFDSDFDPRTPGLKVYGSQRNAENLTDATLAFLEQRDAERPLFLFMHYFDVHAPYMPPEPYYSMYRKEKSMISGTLDDTFRVKRNIRRPQTASKAKKQSDALTRLYAAEVTYTDEHIGRLITWLKEREMLDDTLFIVTADHGETMGEHPMIEVWDHGYSVFDTTVKVPLIIRRPQAWGAGKRVEHLASNIDLMPTLVEMFGFALPARNEGKSFLASMDDKPFVPRTHAFSEATKPSTPDYEKGHSWRNKVKPKGVRTETHKFMHHPKLDRWRLHDVGVDPDEVKNLYDAASPSDLQNALSGELETWVLAADPLGAEKDDDEGSRELLEALGYVEGEEVEEP